MEKIIGLVKALLAAVLLVSCAQAPEPALLPLPKQVEYTGGTIRAGTPETRLVKWMFTCALTTPDGRAAAEVEYSKTPDR